MKKPITPQIFGKLVILSTIIADNIRMFESVKHRKKRAYNAILSTHKKLLSKVITKENETGIYDNWDLLEKHFKYLSIESTIYYCNRIMCILLHKYDFNSFYYNIFKRISKHAQMFEKMPTEAILNYQIAIEKDLHKITKNVELK